jgi:omega-6 fatty acid desaturase (delta-12 desaturase)
MKGRDWTNRLKEYRVKSAWRPIVEVALSIGPYLLLIAAMYLVISKSVSLWWLVPLWLLAAGFYIRIFIIFHDCAHLSFMKNRRLCKYIGFVTGVITFTPYDEWRRSHMIHHGSVGNIDRRGTGDVWTMTAEEYQNSSRMKRLIYRIFRNPLVLFIVSPLVLFLVINRIPKHSEQEKETKSIIMTNLCILTIIILTAKTVGIKYYLLIQLPILFIASAFGVWLFYVQHQFENVYWSRKGGWDIYRAAMEGSSFYKLPRPIMWLTGNIGYHHIHHLNPGIPFYRLKKCQDEIEQLKEIKPLTFLMSLKSIRLKIYDEKRGKMIRFRDVSSSK